MAATRKAKIPATAFTSAVSFTFVTRHSTEDDTRECGPLEGSSGLNPGHTRIESDVAADEAGEAVAAGQCRCGLPPIGGAGGLISHVEHNPWAWVPMVVAYFGVVIVVFFAVVIVVYTRYLARKQGSASDETGD
jgi:hypothetical protein